MAPNKARFHKDFTNPTAKQRADALGPFPFEHKSNESRQRMLLKNAEFGHQPSLRLKREEEHSETKPNDKIVYIDVDEDEDDNEIKAGESVSHPTETITAHTDLDNKKLYVPTSRSETSKAIPKPCDELDWLATVPEEGQSFEEYVSYVTTRSTGRIRPIANPEGLEILLLPIVVVEEHPKRTCKEAKSMSSSSSQSNDEWPEYGPPLNPLLQYTEAFFDQKVRLLPSAKVFVDRKSNHTSLKKRRKVGSKGKSTNTDIGAFATSTAKGQLKLFLPESDSGRYSEAINLAGRCDLSSDRIQIQVTSLLDELSKFRYSRQDKLKSKEALKDFCIMGITMIDLYDRPKDLFCAGMAFGGDKVAAFSFHRYHPFIKMHPEQWHNYSYSNICDGYSYYEDDDQNPNGYKHEPPMCTRNRDSTTNSEYLRRSSKLLSHELGHLYVLDHCIHNRCLMNGTGHLVEDFKAPSHLCGICLRKLQWRTGFDVKQRYKMLSSAFDNMGMKKEHEWVLKQYHHL